MSNPSESEIKTQANNVIKILNETRKYASVNATNYLSLEDTFVQSLETNYYDAVTGAVAQLRSDLNSALLRAPDMITPYLLEYARFAGFPETDVQSIITRLYQYYIDGSKTVKSRNFTFGTPAAGGGNVGNGTLQRLNTDENGMKIENQFADAKTSTCVQDVAGGAPINEELFEIRGSAPERDSLLLSGSGQVGSIKAVSAVDSQNYLDNPSFEDFTGVVDGAVDAINGWTSLAGLLSTNYSVTQGSNYYRTYNGSSTPTSLRILADDTLYQDMNARRDTFLGTNPYYVQLAYNKTIGGVTGGTLELDFGGVSVTVDLGAAAAGWNVLKIVVGNNSWLKTFDTANMYLQIKTTALAGGANFYLTVDDVLVTPFTNFDASWYVLVGGQTRFQRFDKFTWTDTEVGSINQYWLWRAFGRYLPSTTGGGETWVDPT